MGKCTNTKAGKPIPLTEVSHSFLGGVRTRAKTLAAVDYLELRSRRLEKPPLLRNCHKHFRFYSVDLGIEPSIGDNRNTNNRKSTANSSIRPADTITAPGSSTKLKTPISARQKNILVNTPPAQEIEDFFAHLEQTEQRRFIEKYNFDIVNDMPLPGRYEWVEVTTP